MSGSRRRWVLLAALLAPLAASPARAEETGPAATATFSSGIGTVVGVTRPAGSLHVGAALGQETDRTYLRFDAEAPYTITIPLDPDAGTASPEIAEVQACAVPNGFDPEAAEPAEVDCDGAPVATYADGALTVEVLVDGDVALVPTGDGTWQAAFAPDAPTATFETPAAVAPPTTRAPRPSATVAPPVFVAPGGIPIAAPPLPAPPAQAIADQASASPPSAVTGVPAGGTSGFRYAGIFALPLALLVVVGLAGDGLTRPVRLREETA